ncbi:glucose-6-phosphate dehydrogenase assembly protein OpcA [Rothia sp. P7208]|uniref:glucose-6-phosphate dehydrogenase assembly protein OpcA n=1 Tax=Rothia sp. P7208 TaxID=3402660 RepID=UPI003AC7D946
MISHLEQTDTARIEKEISRLREETGNTTSGRVLTLVILADPGHSSAALEAAQRASHEHPCRIIMHISEDADAKNRLDAKIEVGGEAGASDLIVLRGWGQAAHATESLISGLLLPDSPIVVWWPHSVPDHPARHSIGRIAQRRITDSAREADPMITLEKLSESYSAGDTDLAWSRLTLWRIQLAAILDQVPPQKVTRVVVYGSAQSPSVVLLGAWLGHRLDAQVHLATTKLERGLYRVVLEREDGSIVIDRPETNIATVSSPGTPHQQIALPVRTLAECLAEELRRLDPDEVYGEVLQEALHQGNILVELSSDEDKPEGIEWTEPFDA